MTIVGNSAPAKQSAPITVPDVLERYKGEIAKALPKTLTAERFARIALTEFRKTPKLQNCDPFSFLGAVMQSAQLGLEIGGTLGHAYLVPYKAECTLIVGYKGLVDLMRRSGRVKGVWAHVVYADDKFDEGVNADGPFITYHAARLGVARNPQEEIKLVFAIARLDDGTTQWTVMEKWEVERIRAGLRYPSDVWKDHYGEMAKKTVVRRLAKMLPMSPEVVQIHALEDGERASHQPFIDAEIIPPTYELQNPAHDADKINAISAAAGNDHELSHESKAREEKELQDTNIAIEDFTETATVFEGMGGDVKATLKMDKLSVIKMPAPRIRAATGLLQAAIKTKGAKK